MYCTRGRLHKIQHRNYMCRNKRLMPVFVWDLQLLLLLYGADNTTLALVKT